MTEPVMSIEDWLDYGQGGGGEFLKDWKDDGQIDVWPHPKAGVFPRYAHSFWQTRKKKGKGKGGEEETVRSSYRWLCHEKDVIKRKARFRDDEIGKKPHGIVGNGRREYPPESCPMCKLIEYLRDRVRAGDLSFVAPLFEWTLDGDDSDVVLVGGFCGLFSRPKNDYSDDQWHQMMKAGVRQDEAFMDNANARLDYLMRVVADKHPDDGIVIASVADALGRKVQKAYKDRIENSKGKFVPSQHNMCLRWKYDESEDFDKKYDVVALIEAEPSAEVLEALAGELPSLADVTKPGNAAKLRAQMEKHCVVKGIPWDAIFDGVAAAEDGEDPASEPWDEARREQEAKKAAAAAPKSEPRPAEPKPEPKPEPKAAAPAQPAPKPEPQGDASDLQCDVCQGWVKDPGDNTIPDCPHCGAQYDSFTGALIFNPTKPVGGKNQPREAKAAKPAEPAPEPQKPAADAPPAGREPARRRAASK